MKNNEPYHEVWEVLERKDKKPFWRLAGSTFLNKDKSENVIVSFGSREFSWVLQDPLNEPEGQGAGTRPHRVVQSVTRREGKPDFWKRAGATFLNKDGSERMIVSMGGCDFRWIIRKSGRKPGEALLKAV